MPSGDNHRRPGNPGGCARAHARLGATARLPLLSLLLEREARRRPRAPVCPAVPQETQRHLDAVGASLSAFAAGAAAWASSPAPPQMLTAREAAALLEAQAAGSAACDVSLDIGVSLVKAAITPEGAAVPIAKAEGAPALRSVALALRSCFRKVAASDRAAAKDRSDLPSRMHLFSHPQSSSRGHS